MAASMSRPLLEGLSLNVGALSDLNRQPGQRTWLTGETMRVLVHVCGDTQPEPGVPDSWIYFSGLEKACEITRLNKSNVSKALAKLCENGLLRKRGLESHSGYASTVTYEVNAGLITGAVDLGRGVGVVTNPRRRDGGRKGRSDGGREGGREGWQQNLGNPSPDSESESNLTLNPNANSNPVNPSPGAPSVPEHLNGQDLDDWLRDYVFDELVKDQTQRSAGVKHPAAYREKLEAKYRPRIEELIPKHRAALIKNLRHQSRHLVDVVMERV